MTTFGLIKSLGSTWGPVAIVDSFVVSDNKIGAGSGEAKLFIGSRQDPELRKHFGPQLFSADCIMLKSELLDFLDAMQNEYRNPSQNYLNSSKLSNLWNQRRDRILQLPDSVRFVISEQEAGGERRCYIKGDGLFELLRELPLPRKANVTFTSARLENGDAIQLVRLHPIVGSTPVRCWQVQHDATGQQAESSGHLWSPKVTKNGSSSKWYTNMTEVKVGDRVYSYRNGKIQAVGVVTSSAVSALSPFIPVDTQDEGWLVNLDFVPIPTPFSPTEHFDELKPIMRAGDELSVRAPGETAIIGYLKEISVELAEAYDLIGGLSGFGSASQGMSEDDSRYMNLFEKLSYELLLPTSFLNEISELLEDKKQVIFYGPPGAGKTYVAMKLAEALSESEQSAQQVEIVQFHPSYSYEDFVEGFRPIDGGSFILKDGKLLSIVERAIANPERKYYLIIDEINRGNIAKIFGEMFFLLEYREKEIHLQYSDKPFKMPENLYFIGTMNSADRSIGLIDSALRRRFHFVNFYPTQSEMKDVLRNWLARHVPDLVWIADAVDEANEKLDDKNFAIGPSHFMKQNMTRDLFEKIWRRSIVPYVEDIYFSRQDEVEQFQLDRLRTLKRLSQDASSDEIEDDGIAATA